MDFLPPVGPVTAVPLRTSFSLLLLAFLFPLVTARAGAPPPPGLTVIPFTENGGLILLAGRVGQLRGHFILDTGAEGLVLNGDRFGTGRGRSRPASGVLGAVAAEQRTVAGFRLGGLQFGATPAQVIDLGDIELRRRITLLGLVGYRVLRDYEITLDYRRGLATFAALDGDGTASAEPDHLPARVDSFPFELANFLPVLTVRVGERALRMGVDTGAEYNLLDGRGVAALGADFVRTGSVRMYAADGRNAATVSGKLFRLRLGTRYRCAAMRTLVVDLKPCRAIYRTRLDGILGKEFLAPWTFTINYRKRLLYVHRIEFVPPVLAADRAVAN